VNEFAHPRYWPTWVGLGVFRLISLLPLPVLWVLGGALGDLVRLLDRRRRHVARRNLEACFPEMPAAERDTLLRGHFRALMRAALYTSVGWWASPRRLARLFQLENREILDQARAQGRPVILLTPHFVSLENTLWISHDYPTGVVYKKARNALVTRFMQRGRGRFGGGLYERDAFLKTFIKRLRAGEIMIYLPDQNPGRARGVFAPFFGVPAATLPALGRIAQSTGAAVIPCIPVLLPWGRGLRFRLQPALSDYPTGDVVADVTRMNQLIERAVREYPEQYIWVHRRFKVRPDPSEKFYDD